MVFYGSHELVWYIFYSLLYQYSPDFAQQLMFCLSVTVLEVKFGSVIQWKLFAAHTLSAEKKESSFLLLDWCLLPHLTKTEEWSIAGLQRYSWALWPGTRKWKMCFNEGNWQHFGFTPPFVFVTAIKLVCCKKIKKNNKHLPPKPRKVISYNSQ